MIKSHVLNPSPPPKDPLFGEDFVETPKESAPGWVKPPTCLCCEAVLPEATTKPSMYCSPACQKRGKRILAPSSRTATLVETVLKVVYDDADDLDVPDLALYRLLIRQQMAKIAANKRKKLLPGFDRGSK